MSRIPKDYESPPVPTSTLIIVMVLTIVTYPILRLFDIPSYVSIKAEALNMIFRFDLWHVLVYTFFWHYGREHLKEFWVREVKDYASNTTIIDLYLIAAVFIAFFVHDLISSFMGALLGYPMAVASTFFVIPQLRYTATLEWVPALHQVLIGVSGSCVGVTLWALTRKKLLGGESDYDDEFLQAWVVTSFGAICINVAIITLIPIPFTSGDRIFSALLVLLKLEHAKLLFLSPNEAVLLVVISIYAMYTAYKSGRGKG